MLSKSELGQLGEQQAIMFLTQNQYAILERNWRYKRAEIDIIASVDSALVFVEVKSRISDYYEDAELSVNHRKEALLMDAAQRFMEQAEYNGEIRFDIISVYFNKNYKLKKIIHFIDAFFY